MVLIGCDFHPSWQQVSWLDMETGETGEQKLVHAGGEAKQFYEQLAAPVLIGMEATGNSQWFIELVEDLGHEIWIGDAAQIRASCRAGFRADPRRRRAFPARQAGGQLPGTNSTRRKFGRAAETGCDHQARQSHAALVAGGSGASRSSLRSPVSQRVSASLPQEAESGG